MGAVELVVDPRFWSNAENVVDRGGDVFGGAGIERWVSGVLVGGSV